MMRTTITLDDDTAALLQQRMRDQGRSFKQVVNEALRDALTGRAGHEPFTTPVFDLGEPLVPLDRALALASDLEDEELLRELERRR